MTDENQNNKKSIFSFFEESTSQKINGHSLTNGHHYPGMPHDEENEEGDYLEEDYSEETLTEEIDHEILMHRDSHFGGDFNVMLEYYQQDNPGVNPDFDIERIEYLAEVEKELGQNLASLLLSGSEAEKVAKARNAYIKLKEIYEIDNPKNVIPTLIANLILSENEDPHEEIDAVVAQGSNIVPELVNILKSDEAFDPIFPGYGLSPFLAIVCLGLIKDERAIIPLFETLGKEMVFEEDIILDAFAEIGEPAKKFLLKIVTSRPLTEDNTNAAYALIAFRKDPEVAKVCFEQLKDPAVGKETMLANYLVCDCEGLDPNLKQEFIQEANKPNLDEYLRELMKTLIQEWKL